MRWRSLIIGLVVTLLITSISAESAIFSFNRHRHQRVLDIRPNLIHIFKFRDINTLLGLIRSGRGGVYRASSTNGANTPVWHIGDYWKYDMRFGFEYSIVSMKDAKVENMVIEVTEIRDDRYVLELTSDGLEGEISISGLIPIGTLKGSFNGDAEIERKGLGIKSFSMKIKGKVTLGFIPVSVKFDIKMSFDPALNIFDFPLEVGDRWEIDSISKVEMHGKVASQSFSYSSEDEFTDSMMCERKGEVNGFISYLISGEIGEPSELWYSDDAGFLSKVNEKVDWSGLKATYKLDLISTNYKKEGNRPPYTPNKPVGPTTGEKGIKYAYSSSSTDPDGDQIYYMWDWGDGSRSEWIGPFKSGESVTTTHAWNKEGVYNVRVKARDEKGKESGWSEPLRVTIGKERNEPPDKPLIDGPAEVERTKGYYYRFSATDPDDDKVYLRIKFGSHDYYYGEWLGPFPSGKEIEIYYEWHDPYGEYLIRAKAKDEHGAESEWSVMKVTVAKTPQPKSMKKENSSIYPTS